MKSMMKFITMLLICCASVLPVCAAEGAGDAPPLRAAIFVQNRAGADFTDKIDVLNDMLTTRLTEKGFSVIDRAIVLAKFREAREVEPAVKRDIDALEKSSGGIESSLSGASALRIAQMIGADYIIVASLTSYGQETREFKGAGTAYGTNNKSYISTLRISLKVLEGNSGGSVYGDTVSVAERTAVVESLRIETTDIINKLLDAGALKIADTIGGKIQKIREVKVKSVAAVEFTVKSNVEGATVELDGAVIGTTPGRFVAAPGLHQMKISKEWLTSWDRTINIFANQTLNVTLELSQEGIQRFATIEQLKLDIAKGKMRAEMEGKEREAAIEIGKKEREAAIEIGKKEREANIDINKEQSSADAYSKKAIADGEKVKRSESYERIENTPPATIIYK